MHCVPKATSAATARQEAPQSALPVVSPRQSPRPQAVSGLAPTTEVAKPTPEDDGREALAAMEARRVRTLDW
jgi:hypothetical protein